MIDYHLPDEPTRFTPQEFDRLLGFCSQHKASDITLQTNQPIYAEIQGMLYKVTRRALTNAEVSELLNTIYGPNGTAQLLSGKDIDTHYEFRPTRSERYRFRVNGTACQVAGHNAIQITLRTIPNEPPHLASMDLPNNIIDAIAPEQGVIYVTGATGSGKSTLLAAIIRHLAEDSEGHRKILTYESPIEFVFDQIKMPNSLIAQSEIPRHLPSFAAGVRNALRRKPRLILVGEARDPETISAVIEAALTGHPVYTTLHSNGVAETMRRLITSFPSDERHGRAIDIIETMRLVIWQQLIPTTEGRRVPLREYLVFNDDIRDQLLDAELDNITAVTRQLVKEQGHSMLDEAKEKFEKGLIAKKDYRRLIKASESMDLDAGIY